MQLIQFLIALVSIQFLFQNCSAARFGTSGVDPSQSLSASGTVIGGDVGGSSGGGGGGGGNSGSGNSGSGNSGGGGCRDANSTLTCGEELLVNGDFEMVDEREGLVYRLPLKNLSVEKKWDVYSTLPDGKGGASWYSTDGTSGIEIQAGAVVDAASGKNSVELDSHPNQERGNKSNSGIYQMVFVTEAGDYVLAFSYRGRMKDANDNIIDVLVDGVKVNSLALSSSKGGWTSYRWLIPLEAKMHKIEFQAQGLESTYGGLLDFVSLKKACPKVGP